MAKEIDDQGKLELSVRILGNELIGFKMVVDDFKMTFKRRYDDVRMILDDFDMIWG